MPTSALNRHLALVGFMGSGKSTLGRTVAEQLGRPFLDLDKAIEERAGRSIAELFAERGEEGFRAIEEHAVRAALAATEPAVLALGGGAVTSAETRERLRDAFVIELPIDVDLAWSRVRNSSRPLAQDQRSFRRLYAERHALYSEVADATASDADGAVLAAGGVRHERGALERLGELVPGRGQVALVADAVVLGLYGARAREALGSRLATTHELPPGEGAKQQAVLARLWSELRIDREGTIVALGGGCTTDVAGFAAATYLRGVPWVAVPTTLVGQVDAAIGGKTAIDIPEGKNLVGAFHWPARVVLDETLLETLPERERRQGLAELVKTRLLAGRTLDLRGAAAYKTALCLRDPYDRGPRRWLNLGHTFAHALEAAADFDLPHGEAVALGLLAALRLSGRETAAVEAELRPQPVRVDGERAWQALLRDKKRSGDAINLVLLGEDGPFVEARPAAEVRRELERLIAQIPDAMQVLVLNGVNLDMLGKRDPAIYGSLSLNELETQIYEWASELGVSVRCRHTNSEGEYVGWIHDAYGDADALVVNPGAWSHYSYAIHDALDVLTVPIVEVHLTNVEEREEWRRHSVIADLVDHRVIGKGPAGYREALAYLAEHAP